VMSPVKLRLGVGYFENIGTCATTYNGSKITTHHNFGKPGIYNVALKVWGPDGNDTRIKPAYITTMALSTNIRDKAKVSLSKSSKAKLSVSETKASLRKHKHKNHFKHIIHKTQLLIYRNFA